MTQKVILFPKVFLHFFIFPSGNLTNPLSKWQWMDLGLHMGWCPQIQVLLQKHFLLLRSSSYVKVTDLKKIAWSAFLSWHGPLKEPSTSKPWLCVICKHLFLFDPSIWGDRAPFLAPLDSDVPYLENVPVWRFWSAILVLHQSHLCLARMVCLMLTCPSFSFWPWPCFPCVPWLPDTSSQMDQAQYTEGKSWNVRLPYTCGRSERAGIEKANWSRLLEMFTSQI